MRTILVVPVILKTAVHDDDKHRQHGLAAGADVYLSEPVEPQVLLETVERLLKRAP